MKIQKFDVYLGTVFICNIYEKRDPRKDYYSEKDSFKGLPDRENVLFLKIGKFYVPVDEITGPHDLNKLMRASKDRYGYDRRFLTRTPYRLGQKYLDINNPPVRYFSEEGEVSLKALWKIQKELQPQEIKETEI